MTSTRHYDAATGRPLYPSWQVIDQDAEPAERRSHYFQDHDDSTAFTTGLRAHGWRYVLRKRFTTSWQVVQ